MFLRHQFTPEFVPATDAVYARTGQESVRALQPGYSAPAPQGRCDMDTWGPDRFGYTDCDDYYTAIYGA